MSEGIRGAAERLLGEAGLGLDALTPAQWLVVKQVERPKQALHGDVSSPAALTLAKILKQPPLAVAERLASILGVEAAVADRVEVVKPGFVNAFFSPRYLSGLISGIERAGAAYGRTDRLKGRKMILEFVSANPTGNVNVVSGRSAAVGSTLVQCARAAGADAWAEFYVNDAGRQFQLLGESVVANRKKGLGLEAAIPEGGYQGEEVAQFSMSSLEQKKPSWGKTLQEYVKGVQMEDPRMAAREAVEHFVGEQRRDLEAFGVVYDQWFYEHTLHDAGEVRQVIETAHTTGASYEQEGAVWLKLTQVGLDKDEVLVRSTGEPTYFAADIAYHLHKYRRGFDEALDFWGPDHHGHIIRLQKALAVFGVPETWLEVKIVQQVNLMRGGEKVKMSKRAGQTVRLKELIEEVGVDATRFFFLMRNVDSHLDFDVELAKKATDDNPVFYVQYAHARACNVLAHAQTQGLTLEESADVERLVAPEERGVMRWLDRFPEVVETAALTRSPNLLTNYVQELSTAFHHFYAHCRVVTEDRPLSLARLRLVQAVRVTLRNGLALLGVSAPEKM